MADHLTFTLAALGLKARLAARSHLHRVLTASDATWQAYKYVPYGPVAEVMPYLIRRAQARRPTRGRDGARDTSPTRAWFTGERRRAERRGEAAGDDAARGTPARLCLVATSTCRLRASYARSQRWRCASASDFRRPAGGRQVAGGSCRVAWDTQPQLKVELKGCCSPASRSARGEPATGWRGGGSDVGGRGASA